ncbi:MAG TPA: peptidylprolyl isomerase [Chitinivibrionales bacterium]|nr:peptidylprolyl isomerase [Chitinivibrionales bacterium]
MNRLIALASTVVLAVSLSSYAANPKVKIETSKGDIVVELYQKSAPKTVANFLAYVKDGFYDGTIFHRVIKGFMIQGGGFTKDMQEKPTKAPVVNEADNGLKNDIGTIAMARTGDPHSATAQFFINTVNNQGLNFRSKDVDGWGYCVFGKVVSGMDVVTAIEGVPVADQGPFQAVPQTQVVITKVSAVGPAVTKKTPEKTAAKDTASQKAK